MIPTYVQTAIIWPGMRMREDRPPGNNKAVMIFGDTDTVEDWVDHEARVVYSVDRHHVIDLNAENAIKERDGKLDEKLFVFSSLIEVSDRTTCTSDWLLDWLAEGGYDCLDADTMKELYAIAAGKLEVETHRTLSLLDTIGFVVIWDVEMDNGGPEEYPEVSNVFIVGEGEVVVREKVTEQPPDDFLTNQQCP